MDYTFIGDGVSAVTEGEVVWLRRGAAEAAYEAPATMREDIAAVGLQFHSVEIFNDRALLKFTTTASTVCFYYTLRPIKDRAGGGRS